MEGARAIDAPTARVSGGAAAKSGTNGPVGEDGTQVTENGGADGGKKIGGRVSRMRAARPARTGPQLRALAPDKGALAGERVPVGAGKTIEERIGGHDPAASRVREAIVVARPRVEVVAS